MMPTQEIDVFATTLDGKFSLDHLPDVEKLPTLPHMRQIMEVDLAVNAEGRVYIFYDGVIPEETEYVVYSIDDATLNLISHNGRIQDIGMKIHQPMRKYMRKADNIYIIEMNNGHPGRILNIPMISHEIGF